MGHRLPKQPVVGDCFPAVHRPHLDDYRDCFVPEGGQEVEEVYLKEMNK